MVQSQQHDRPVRNILIIINQVSKTCSFIKGAPQFGVQLSGLCRNRLPLATASPTSLLLAIINSPGHNYLGKCDLGSLRRMYDGGLDVQIDDAAARGVTACH